MARYEHLPIYKKAMELNVYLHKNVRHFSRYNKYTIGTELRDAARGILLSIIRANSSYDKEKAITGLIEKCEMLKTLLIFANGRQRRASYPGYFRHADTFGPCNAIFNNHPCLNDPPSGGIFCWGFPPSGKIFF